MEEQIRDFKGVWIPKEIWLNNEMTLLDKIILIEIDSLDVTEEGCYASNSYLAEFCNCTETKISLSIKKLIDLEYLEVIKFDGRHRYIKSRLKKIYMQPLKKLKSDIKKVKAININNKLDNNIIKKENIKEKNKYGEFNNVLLTDEEYKKIEEQHLTNFINKLSIYIESKGKKYKSHYATILNWSRKENKTTYIKPTWLDRTYKEERATEEEIEELNKLLGE